MRGADADPTSLLVGDFGRWQAAVSLLLSLLKLPVGWFQLSIVFLAPATRFRCASFEETPGDPEEFSNACSSNCSEYEFDESVFERTIVSEWSLICDRKRLADDAQMSFMLGVLVGNFVFGIASDGYGRKIPLTIAIAIQGVASMAIAFVPWFWCFLLLRFVLAVSTGGIMVTSFTMCVEMVGGKWRTYVPILHQIPFGLANTVMALMAFFLRDWRRLTFATSLLSMIFASYRWLIPESPRWLLAVGKRERALKILEKAAATNGGKPKNFRSVVSSLEGDRSPPEKELAPKTPPFLGLFKTKNLRRNTLILCANWFAAGTAVFGVTQYAGFIGKNDDVFFNVGVGGLVIVPGTVACIFAVERFGRKKSMIASGLAFGASCMLVGALPGGSQTRDWSKILSVFVSITCMSIAFPALYLYSGEILPTVARNGGLGAFSVCARLGSMIAPYVVSTRSRGEHVPLLVLGGLPTVTILLMMSMPETKGRNLPDTLEEGENFGKKRYEPKVVDSKSDSQRV